VTVVGAYAQLPKPGPADPNPWNGSWKLDVQRSSPVAAQQGVPQVYRLTLGPGPAADVPIKWEIPELGEVVTGRTNDTPMRIVRSKPSPGLTLAVRATGVASLLYSIFRDGRLVGGGRMMLIDNGSAWVDLTWPADRQDLASALVYAKE
jgi:hypothetical protein